MGPRTGSQGDGSKYSEVRIGLGSLYVSGKLPNYPSPKPTLTLTSHLGKLLNYPSPKPTLTLTSHLGKLLNYPSPKPTLTLTSYLGKLLNYPSPKPTLTLTRSPLWAPALTCHLVTGSYLGLTPALRICQVRALKERCRLPVAIFDIPDVNVLVA